MTSIRKLFGKKVAKATLRHSIHGLTSKAQRQPLRTGTLLGVGGILGATAGWFVGRKSG
jgi:hypothetical protein